VLFAVGTKFPNGDLSLDMTICKTNDIILMISSGQRLLGLDVGKKTIGLALSDRGLKIASPLKILYRTKFTLDATTLLEIIDAESIGGLVLGWPVNMDGSIGPRCDSVRDFAHALLKFRDLPIAFQDERMSTRAVESAMLAADMTRAKRAERRDALAACWILQSALDLVNDEQASSTQKNTPPHR
jgi:putative Holliday junction resolvase